MLQNKLFKVPQQTINTKQIIKDDESLLMSDELSKVGLEDFDADAVKVFKERSKITIIKYKLNNENDVLIGTLKGLGFTPELENTFSIELNVEQQKAIEFFNNYRNNRLQIFGIDLEAAGSTTELLAEHDVQYDVLKCNIYDIAIQCDDCTLVLLFKNI